MALTCDCSQCCTQCGPHEPSCISWDLLRQAAEDEEPCSFMLKLGGVLDPPEYCEEDREPGTEYCGMHQEE